MLDACFVRLLVLNFGSTTHLHVLLGERGQEVVVIALVEPTGLYRWRVYCPSQAQAALVVVNPSVSINFEELLAAFPTSCARLDLFALDPREHLPLLSGAALAEKRLAARNICVDLTGDFEGYWQSRSPKLRQNVRRYRKRITEELGQLRATVVTHPDQVASATDRYGILESRGWKGRVGTALHPGNLQGEFYRSLMAEMAEQSRSYVFELYADEILLASRLCLAGDNILVMIKTAFDERYKRYAAGRLLLYDVLQHFYEKQVFSVVDFYTNANDDQMEWATTSRSMVHSSIYSSGPAKWAFASLRYGRSLVHKRLLGLR